jgi:hypothetical protein
MRERYFINSVVRFCFSQAGQFYVVFFCRRFIDRRRPVSRQQNTNRLSIADLQNTVVTTRWAVRSFRIEGVVCAVVPQRNIVVLQDASASVLLELPSVSPAVRVGDGLAGLTRFDGHLGGGALPIALL